MVITKDELLVLIDYYETKIANVDLKIYLMENSEASKLLSPDIIEIQTHTLIGIRDLNENRLKKLKSKLKTDDDIF